MNAGCFPGAGQRRPSMTEAWNDLYGDDGLGSAACSSPIR